MSPALRHSGDQWTSNAAADAAWHCAWLSDAWIQCWILVSNSDKPWSNFQQNIFCTVRDSIDAISDCQISLDRYGTTEQQNNQILSILSQLEKSRSRAVAEANGTEVHLSNREASIAGQALSRVEVVWSGREEVSGKC